MEGPRGAKREELESLRELTDLIFRPGMMGQYPQLFNEDNLENLRVFSKNGGCVSHVGMTQRDATLFGCPIRVCCVGGVATHPDYRQLGYASACFDDATAKAFRDGVDVMIVSGDRRLYRSRGCLNVGCDALFRLSQDAPLSALEMRAQSFTISPYTEASLSRIQDCYRREPVRFLRPLEDYRYFLQSGWAMNSPAELWTISEQGDFRGYALVRLPKNDRHASLTEFAGERSAILGATPLLLRAYDFESLSFQVMGQDRVLRSLAEKAGLVSTPRTTSGTVKIVHFAQLMERLRPHFVEVLGAKTARRLRFWQEGDIYGFGLGEERFETDRDTATYAVFGAIEGLPKAIEDRAGALGEALRAILPLPTLWYGINYV